MARIEIRTLAGRLGLGEECVCTAERLVTEARMGEREFGPHCAVLAAGRMTARSGIGLKEIWAGNDPVDVNVFFRTLADFAESVEIPPGVKASLEELYETFRFEYTFYRKFEELWRECLPSPSSSLLRRFSWLLFLYSRSCLAPSLDLIRTALVLLGVLTYVSDKRLHNPAAALALASKLMVREEEAVDYCLQVDHLVRELPEIASESLGNAVSVLETMVDSVVINQVFDGRILLIDGKLVITPMQTFLESANREDAVMTPISQGFRMKNWLMSLRSVENSTKSVIFDYIGETNGALLTERLAELNEKLESLERFDHCYIPQVSNLYLKHLHHMIFHRRGSPQESEFQNTLRSDSFHRSLLAVALECVLYAGNLSHISFEDVLRIAHISAFDFWKVQASVYARDTTFFPKELKRHFKLVEEKVITSGAWGREETVPKMIERLFEAESPSEEAGESARVIPLPLSLFLQQVASFSARRVVDLGRKLLLEELQMERIWTEVKYLLSEDTEILFGRHLDQLILCAVFHIASPSLTWSDIFASYSDLSQSEIFTVQRSVHSLSSRLTIEDFYTRLIRPRLRDHHLCDLRHTRIKEFHPIGGLTTVARAQDASGRQLPLRSPFRDTSLTPTSQRLFSSVPEFHSDRRLNFEDREKALAERPENLQSIIAGNLVLQNLARTGKK